MAEVSLSIQSFNLSVVLRVKDKKKIPGFQEIFSQTIVCLEEEEEEEEESETVEL